MAIRLCIETALVGCLALAASIWGIQSTAPAVVSPEDAVQSDVSASLPLPLATVVLPAGVQSQRLAASHSSGSDDAMGGLAPKIVSAEIAENDFQTPSLFHRADLGKRIPDARNASPGAGHAMEVASFLPSASDGT
ncbi:MAG: hypothetical protein AMXMBFR82_16890 [Candidatus Hydrogenedentota bacterium]